MKVVVRAHRNEEAWNLPLILIPCLPILVFTFGDIPHGSVADHDREEDRVEPGKGAVEPGD